MDSSRIAKKLVELRGSKSRESVANALGLSLSTLTMYEIGARIPRDENKEKIARYYGKTVDEIFSLKFVTICDTPKKEVHTMERLTHPRSNGIKPGGWR